MTKAIDNQEIAATVRIRVQPTKGNPDGITEINKSDYDAAKHQLVDDGEQPSLNLAQSGQGGAPAPDLSKAGSLYGSSVQPALLDVGKPEQMQLGAVVGFAHSRSGLSIDAWNALPDPDREAKIAAELALIRTANGYKPKPLFS